ncbi:BON domain-containing protein [Microvirga sp. 2YAF29]|uniref:BON domain-containing protein n=1 Tax=Microvirga sp. 2YAF29 TaxID=3233031 RepID=UPI003F9A1F0B
MVDPRRRNRNPSRDDNGYGDVPQGGAVGLRGDSREYPSGYGRPREGFAGGVIEDGHRGPPDDEGFAPSYDRRRSGLGAFGDRDPNDPDLRSDDDAGSGPSGLHRGRGPKGYKRTDDRIHEDVCERLTHDRFIDASDVEVNVSKGEVTLSGTVSSRGLKRRAEDLAEMASGVTHVQNNLRVEGV